MQHPITESWIGRDLVGSDGDKIGTIKDVYLDASTDQPEWVSVSTGMLSGASFVPLAEAAPAEDAIRVPYDKALIKDAPSAKPDGELSQHEEARLYDHYGLVYGESRSGSGLPEYEDEPVIEEPVQQVAPVEPPHEPVGHDVSGPTTDDAMTRSEEELHVGTEQVPVGRARLRKHIVSEQVQTTVPVQREQVRVEREPITDANIDQAVDGPALSEEEHEVVLYDEEPVVEKRVVPKERVRMDTDVVTEDVTVSEEVRSEQIDVDDPEHARGR